MRLRAVTAWACARMSGMCKLAAIQTRRLVHAIVCCKARALATRWCITPRLCLARRAADAWSCSMMYSVSSRAITALAAHESGPPLGVHPQHEIGSTDCQSAPGEQTPPKTMVPHLGIISRPRSCPAAAVACPGGRPEKWPQQACTCDHKLHRVLWLDRGGAVYVVLRSSSEVR